ncbi:MAG: glyoxylate/hydroxypyruvate reductase A [Pseudomonadota bacterium]
MCTGRGDTLSLNVLFAALPHRWPQYRKQLEAAFAGAGVDCTLVNEIDDPARVDVIVYAPNSGLEDFGPFTNLKAVLNLWAGVEDIVDNTTLQVPLARMVDPGLTQGMIEWVTAHVLRHHLEIDLDITCPPGDWRYRVPKLASQQRVGILGLGSLGAACADALVSLGFDVAGWSRTAHDASHFPAFHGSDGLEQLIQRSDILVLLLPLTEATSDLIDAERLALLPKGAVLLNPGRGGLVDDAALLEALESGQVGHATLDTFRVEPLPPDHPFWTHPRVTVTPHIASATRPETASRVIAENVRRVAMGAPLLHLVDRGLGY